MSMSVKPISDHAELENKAYADAGHTGFVAVDDVPIEAVDVESIQSRPIRGVGQVTLTNGSNVLTGIGTTFIGDSGFHTLDYWYQIYVGGVLVSLNDVTTETTAELNDNWAGATQTIDLVFSTNTVSGSVSGALGVENIVSSEAAFAIGSVNNISGNRGIALGYNNNVSGIDSGAMGSLSVVAGNNSIAVGTGLLAPGTHEVAVGAYNTSYTPANNTTDRAFVVGNGTDGVTRSNAFIVLKNGNADLAGTMQMNGLRIDQTPTSGTITPTHYITISCNGTDYKIPVVAA